MIAPEYSCFPSPKELGDELDGIFNNPNYWHLYFENINWLPGSVDGLFRLVIDEMAFNVMIVSPKLGWIFHPYNGEADIVLKNKQEMLRVKNKFLNWLPTDLSKFKS